MFIGSLQYYRFYKVLIWSLEIKTSLCFISIKSINWDQFNQLYDLDWMKKGIRNADIVVRKLGPALTKATNHR